MALNPLETDVTSVLPEALSLAGKTIHLDSLVQSPTSTKTVLKFFLKSHAQWVSRVFRYHHLSSHNLRESQRAKGIWRLVSFMR